MLRDLEMNLYLIMSNPNIDKRKALQKTCFLSIHSSYLEQETWI